MHHLMGDDITYSWYTLVSIIAAGLICAIPTLLLCTDEGVTNLVSNGQFPKKAEHSRKWFHLRILCHFLLLYGIVSLLGYVFRWYGDMSEYGFTMIGFVLVYIFVWLFSIWIWKQEEDEINHALKDIQDEE